MTLLETWCFFIIEYSKGIVIAFGWYSIVLPVLRRSQKEMTRSDKGRKRKMKECHQPGEGRPLCNRGPTVMDSALGGNWTRFWRVISQATFHDWTSDGDEAVAIHVLHAWMFKHKYQPWNGRRSLRAVRPRAPDRGVASRTPSG